jgi:Leucine-rich repeat (LRR) protein
MLTRYGLCTVSANEISKFFQLKMRNSGPRQAQSQVGPVSVPGGSGTGLGRRPQWERNEKFFENSSSNSSSNSSNANSHNNKAVGGGGGAHVRGGIRAGAGAAPSGSKGYMRQARETGQINLSNRNLDVCPKDVFYIDDNLGADEKYWEVVPINKLDLSHNAITVLPEDVERLAEALATFKIRDNALIEVPEGLYQCIQLRHVDLAMNRLSRISDSIKSLPYLRELFLGCNEITSIPETLANCVALQVLELQENKLRWIGPQLSIPGLLHLNLSSNQLSELPDVISTLTALTSLQFKKNNIIRVPDLSQLKKLTFLDASENRIEDFPVLPQGISCLDRVFLGNNRIRSIVIESLVPSQCACLSELLINDNSLSDIPYNIGLLANCKVLDFSNNNINDLPASIGWMNAVQRFGAEGNPIRSIRRTVLTQSTVELKNYLRTRGPPAGSAAQDALQQQPVNSVQKQRQQLHAKASSGRGGGAGGGSGSFEYDPYDPDLQVNDDDIFSGRIRAMHSNMLDLSKLGVSELPSNLIHKLQMSHGFDSDTMSLSGILKLNLSENNLQRVPVDVLLQLPHLSELNMSNNSFGTLPASLPSGTGQLFPASLRLLDISKCKLQTSHFLMFVMCGRNLKELRAHNNAIDFIPSELNTHCNSLRELKLNNNHLTSIANVDFALFPFLEIVDFTDNKIVSIEPILRSLLLPDKSKLSTVLVDNNNIHEVPALFCKFNKLQHFGLFGNPQKTVRSNQLGNAEAIIRSLSNKVTEADEEFLQQQLQAHQQQHRQQPATAAAQDTSSRDRDTEFEYGQASRPQIHQGRGHVASSRNNAPSGSASVGSQSVSSYRDYRDRDHRDDFSERELPSTSSSSQYYPPAAVAQPSYGAGSNRRAAQGRVDDYYQDNNNDSYSSGPPPAAPVSSSGQSAQSLRAEIALLEREMEDLSMSTTRKTQVKRALALNRAALLKLTK